MNWLRDLFGGGNRSEDTALGSHSRSGSALAAAPALNLVDGINALSAYYRYVEAEAYDAELKTARDRRDFHADFLKRIDALICYQADVNAERMIQLEIAKELAAFGAGLPFPGPRDVDLEARSRNAEGYALLTLSAPLTWESLRVAYREAAKRHHPDVGGDDVTMQKVNDAYALFAAILRRAGAQDVVTQGQPAVDSVARLFGQALVKRFALLIDDLAGDDAYDAYKQMSLEKIEGSNCVDLVARLCQLLAAAGRETDAKAVLADLNNLTERGANRGLNFRPICIAAAEAVKDPKHIRFIPNHARQADNLLRLGIIDKARHEAVLKRIAGNEEQADVGHAAFEEYVRPHQFLRLPKDPLPDSVSISGLVPSPGYYSRVETLSPVQLREYGRAFHGDAPELVTKYFAVRLDALLRAPFMGYSDTEAVLQELRFFASAPGLQGSQVSLCQQALTVVEFLANLTPSEREERIFLLNSLDGIPGQMQITISAITQGSVPRLPRPIFLNPQFIEFATGPLERIERYVRTGSEHTLQEREIEKTRWQEARAFQESELYKRARNITWAKQKDPNEVVAAVSALCEAMYERVAQGDTTMEIGYWTNDLTINLVKLKRYDEARRWIDRLSTAPSEIQKRTSGSVAAALAKRRDRCLKAAEPP